MASASHLKTYPLRRCTILRGPWKSSTSPAGDNLGIVADTFSLWASGTAWDEVRELDPRLILLVHVDDSMQRTGDTWTNEPRQCLPGDGVVPLREGISAIRESRV